MHIKIIFIYCTILAVFFLEGCANNLSYINNDNYYNSYHYYLQSFKLNSQNYNLISVFNDKNSYITTKKIINNMKDTYINNYNLCILILYPPVLFNENKINIFVDYTRDLYTFLTVEKNFTNQLYVLGFPSPDLDKYECIIYFVNY